MGANLSAFGHNLIVLLGRDLLKSAVFIYNGFDIISPLRLKMADDPKPKRKRGRPPKVMLGTDAPPERIAQAVFATAKRPDHSLRKPRRGTMAKA